MHPAAGEQHNPKHRKLALPLITDSNGGCVWSLWNNYSPYWYTLRDDISSDLEGNKNRINLLAVKILLWKDLLFPLQ